MSDRKLYLARTEGERKNWVIRTDPLCFKLKDGSGYYKVNVRMDNEYREIQGKKIPFDLYYIECKNTTIETLVLFTLNSQLSGKCYYDDATKTFEQVENGKGVSVRVILSSDEYTGRLDFGDPINN